MISHTGWHPKEAFARTLAATGLRDVDWPAERAENAQPFIEFTLVMESRPRRWVWRDMSRTEGGWIYGPEPLPVFTFRTENGLDADGHWTGKGWYWTSWMTLKGAGHG